MRLTNRLILLLVLITAIILRFVNYFEIPFTHDEFSALFRLDFGSFSELIEKGVKIDGHPAGIQVFLYYWTKLFGSSEWIVKLPFTIFGILSVWLSYKIATKWFNETVGLITSAFLASIQFTVMYSQIARPYISGLFFSLLMVYYWSMLIKQPDKHFFKNIIFFILAASLCAYNHYFSLLFAAIVGFSGLFFIQKKYLFKYIISGFVIFALYLPHLNIFLYQLKIGGVGGWLGKPHNDFIIRYIEYIFNFSIFSIIMTLGLVVFGAKGANLRNVNYKHYALFIIWFLLPFLIGFYYSKYYSSVLQFSVLIFCFPFLFLVLFGHIKLQKTVINLILVMLILSVNIYTLVFNRRHYDLFYHSIYKEILLDYNEVKKNSVNTLFIIDSHKKITNYYSEKLKIDIDFISYDSFSNEADLITFLEQNSNYTKLYFGCLSSINPLSIPIIQDYYPTIEWQRNYVGGTTFLFSKNSPSNNDTPIEYLGFETGTSNFWSSIDLSKITDSLSFSGEKSYIINNETEWGPTFSEDLNDIMLNENNFIDISLKARAIDNMDDVILVATLDADNGTIYWGGTNFNKFILPNQSNNKWITIHHSIKLSDVYLNYGNIRMKVYVWNKGKRNLFIDEFKIKLRTGNPVIYGLNEKI